ncbi:indole-3-glycerol phosphate synthase TrpC [Megasphaera butyrica]|uniref:indole-3-glycerol phosphate synthase TrpC n=1 Tax=Megasphaera butyrica TaxID=2981791 RepID=UPI000820C82B|nr:indole-3-glycerol phosphate synthase TrpC [Megasphaera butyrica]MCU6713730.1 indole-3-glycerol phosphate synthase TrpC [Megasphaera butyrica]SCH16117.1 Indole-3-glycerol phosphate synthase [uncultured Megasphaera sp.]SCJ32241.1 Indole-3-glycerol phosphate synthase [uncultured Ruminococcus sp.]
MILDTIAAAVARRLTEDIRQISRDEMRQMALATPAAEGFPFEQALRRPGISAICEVKRASPSKGVIAEQFPYVDIAREYEQAGAAAISVLTERDYFQGSCRYLQEISSAVKTPLLRKDFIIDEYQVDEARRSGASAILLICALLDDEQLDRLFRRADSLGLSALVEAHDEDEVRRAVAVGARIIGVNNRNLKDFSVSLDTSCRLRPLVPKDTLFVAESGIRCCADIDRLREAGADAVLIGETLMRSADKKAALAELTGERHG